MSQVRSEGDAVTLNVPVPVLSQRERDILLLLVRGYDAPGMAAELHISLSYVYLLLRMLRSRFFVRTTAAIVTRALELGLVTLDGKVIL